MDRILLWVIIAGLLALIMILLWPKQPPIQPIDPTLEGADGTWTLSLDALSKQLQASTRPLIEYPGAATTQSLDAPQGLEKPSSKVSRRPLIEYPNSVLTVILAQPSYSPAVALRPLVERASSGTVFTLQLPTDADLSQVQPRPLVEYADGGWALTLSVPTELLQRKYAVPPSGFGRSQGDSVAAAEWVFLLCEPLPSSSLQKILMW
jgi:hypothetical protein